MSEWWKKFDWSMNETIFKNLNPKQKERIIQKGKWSLGSGNFEKSKTAVAMPETAQSIDMMCNSCKIVVPKKTFLGSAVST